VRVFRPLFALRFRYFVLCLRVLFKSPQEKEKEVEKWFENMAPVGVNPFEAVTTYKTWASIDDSDFNGHLSNSSYAKTYDSARFKTALSYFPGFFRAGGWMALGATHYHFLREIRMFHSYEVRVRIVGWDNKWLFVIGRYVSHSKVKPTSTEKGKETPPTETSLSAMTTFQASLRTPKDGFDTPVTPANHVKPSQTSSSNLGEATEAMKLIAASQLQKTEEADGATLHCIAISQLCFKHGRITVPPGFVLAASGFSAPPPPSTTDSDPAYSLSNPPPHFSHVQQLLSPRASAKYRDLLRGGWKDVPEAERWWVDALGGVVEERRRANVEGFDRGGPMGALRRGMEGARNV